MALVPGKPPSFLKTIMIDFVAVTGYVVAQQVGVMASDGDVYERRD